MRWLLATTALALSMGVAQASFADDDVPPITEDQAQTDGASGSDATEEGTSPDTLTSGTPEVVDGSQDYDSPAVEPSDMESMEPASGANVTDPTIDSANDAIEMSGDRAMLAAGAMSASNIIGGDVVGPTGDAVGTVDDLVLGSDDNGIEQVIVADGGVFGLGGKNVAIDFAGAQLTTEGDGGEARIRIGMTDEALDQAAEFDESQLEQAGDRLVSSYLDREVRLQGSDAEGEIQDLVINADGTAQYAIVAFGGLLDTDDDRVAVEMEKLSAAGADEPLSLSMSAEELQSAPRYDDRPAGTALAE